MGAQAGDHTVLKRMQAFHYFEKRDRIRATGNALLLLALGTVYFFLFKGLEQDAFPLVVGWGRFYFRYSLFGNIFLAVACVRLARLEQVPALRTLFLCGTGLYLLHGLSSFADYTGIFRSNVYLELLAALFPLLLLAPFFVRCRRPGFRLLCGVSLLIVLATVTFFCFAHFGRFLFALALHQGNPPLELFGWLAAAGNARSYRYLHLVQGIVLAGAVVALYFRRRCLEPGFAEFERSIHPVVDK